MVSLGSPNQLRWRWVALALLLMAGLVLASSAYALWHFGLLVKRPGEELFSQELRQVGSRLLLAQTGLLAALGVVIYWAVQIQRREQGRMDEAQAKVRANEALFRIISNHVSDFITVSGMDGQWTYVSASCERHLGPEASLLGKNLLDSVHPEDRPRIEKVFQELVRSGAGRRVRYRIQAQDGTTPFIESAGNVVRDAEGAVEKVVVVSRDVTEEQKAEDALRKTMERFERQNAAIAEHAHSSEMLGNDPVSAYRRVTEISARTLGLQRVSVWFFTENMGAIRCADLYDAARQLHTSGAEISSSSYPKYFAALAEGRVITAHHAQLDPRTAEFARDYLHPRGITSMLDAPLRQAGRLVGVICHEHVGEVREWMPDEEAFASSMADLLSLSLEIWRHRATEAELRETKGSLEDKVARRTSELEEANAKLMDLDRLKSEFIATMSHELRTPLNSIIGFTGILRQKLPGPLNEEQEKQLGMVHRAAKHLLGLINDILDLSRIESGRMEMQFERFRVADLAREVVDQLQPLASAKGVDLHATIPSPALEICSDRKKCVQILLNLAANAVKFTQRGHVGIAVYPETDGVSVAVTDSGIGIKPEHQAGLFQAFRQVDGTARRVYEGTGLGLYLCKKLSMLLGGDIAVKSTFGVGSCFTVRLPAEAKLNGVAP